MRCHACDSPHGLIDKKTGRYYCNKCSSIVDDVIVDSDLTDMFRRVTMDMLPIQTDEEVVHEYRKRNEDTPDMS